MAPLEPWEKVYISLGSKEFISELDSHLGMVGCEECHGGDAGEQDDPHKAHEGLIPDPSRAQHQACKQCHWSITEDHQDSMHVQLWGEKKTLAIRTGSDDFESCPAALKEGFLGECTSCHATCGDCHISQPDSVGKGFIKSHKFQKPHQKNQCMACHGSRIAFDFLGDDETGRQPDVHFLKGKNCMSCHTGDQLHAPREFGADRYNLEGLTTCEECHLDAEDANAYHATHWDDLSCHVCHAQAYNNCTACHVTGAWKDDPIYAEKNPDVQFKIGLNPLEDRRFKFVTLRHAPVSPESYNWWEGVDNPLTHFDDLETWKYATPHSIRLWTPRTEVAEGSSCGASCHLGIPGGSPGNADWYLWKDYVDTNFPLEADANDGVVVDGMLPDDWTNE